MTALLHTDPTAKAASPRGAAVLAKDTLGAESAAKPGAAKPNSGFPALFQEATKGASVAANQPFAMAPQTASGATPTHALMARALAQTGSGETKAASGAVDLTSDNEAAGTAANPDAISQDLALLEGVTTETTQSGSLVTQAPDTTDFAAHAPELDSTLATDTQPAERDTTQSQAGEIAASASAPSNPAPDAAAGITLEPSQSTPLESDQTTADAARAASPDLSQTTQGAVPAANMPGTPTGQTPAQTTSEFSKGARTDAAALSPSAGSAPLTDPAGSGMAVALSSPAIQPVPVAGSVSGATAMPASSQPPLAMLSPEWSAELVNSVRQHAAISGETLTLTLTPERLGTLQIRLELKDGLTHVHIVTNSAEAARVMTEGQHRLGDLLARAGLEMGNHTATNGSTATAASGQQTATQQTTPQQTGAGNVAANAQNNAQGGGQNASQHQNGEQATQHGPSVTVPNAPAKPETAPRRAGSSVDLMA